MNNNVISGVSGALLVGGASRRMGADKAALDFFGQTLAQRALGVLSRLFAEVLVVGRRERAPLAAFAKLPPGARVVADDPRSIPSALSGIHTALAEAGQPWVFIMACDMPYPSPRLIRGLCETALAFPPPPPMLVVPESDARLHPLHAVWHRSALPALAERIGRGDLRVQDFANMAGTAVPDAQLRRWDPALMGLVNVNTPEELATARRVPPDHITDLS